MLLDLDPVIQKVDSVIHRINLYPVDSANSFPNTYPLGRDLSDGYRYPIFQQLGPVLQLIQEIPAVWKTNSHGLLVMVVLHDYSAYLRWII